MNTVSNDLDQGFSECEARLPWGAPEGFRGGAATEKIKYLSTYTDKDD